ncbi:putative mitochondrial intermediate peptidase, mitochondrial [Porphyridium purpureum]|uniref:Putative mitochondrial intermediate peptidase, mitochondrial n=1 Tax=Porphyridium purpureum TaxID=35688 RepID=A0A5J4Z8A7_PORPP|nr:putative mitochondrial intermediate peptidase, mitochondrial [Porphyridium purpureum]|eukprot:POR6683..scf295_1
MRLTCAVRAMRARLGWRGAPLASLCGLRTIGADTRARWAMRDGDERIGTSVQSRFACAHSTAEDRARDAYEDGKGTRPGQFGIQGLHMPSDWGVIAERCLLRSDALVREIEALDETPDVRVLYLFDELSDTLCRVVDGAELCRNVHPDSRFVEQSDQVYALVAGFMQKLNANTRMFRALDQVRRCDALWKTLTEEEQIACDSLILDFERGGIGLDDEHRVKCVQIQQQIALVGAQFSASIHNQESTKIAAPVELLRGHLPPDLLDSMSVEGGCYMIDSDPEHLAHLLQIIESEPVRKEIFCLAYSEPNRMTSLALLHRMLDLRQQLATMLGFLNSAEMHLNGFRLAPSVEHVWKFLECVRDAIQPKVDDEIQLLRMWKTRHLGSASFEDTQIFEWDRPFYRPMARLENKHMGNHTHAHALHTSEHSNNDSSRTHHPAPPAAGNSKSPSLDNYFPLDAVLGGLDLVLRSVFGIHMELADMEPGESWSEQVLKYKLLQNDEKGALTLLGVVYMDLFPRPNKYSHSAHFVIRCGRHRRGTKCRSSDLTSHAVLDENRDIEPVVPVVALVCNFARSPVRHPHTGARVHLLKHSHVETLFHEFGHVLHSILSKTSFQHLAGTRTTLDFVEIPAHFFEHFASDYRVLRQFARHYITGSPLPQSTLSRHMDAKRMFAGMDVQTQVLYAASDLAFHSFWQPDASMSSTELYADIRNQFSSVSCPPGLALQATLSHLFGYSTGYYSYLYAQVISAHIWAKLFENDPLNREAGDFIRRKLLEPGGAKHAREILHSVLGDEPPSLAPFLAELGMLERSDAGVFSAPSIESCFQLTTQA